MRNATLKSVRDVVARGVGKCAVVAGRTNPEVCDFINEAEQRLLNRKDMPVGSLVPYSFCSSQNCIILPRQVVGVEGYTVCGVPGTVLPIWYTTHANGPGIPCPTSGCGGRAIDQGTVVCFENVNGGAGVTGHYIRLYAQSATDAGKKVILKYYRADTRAKHYSGYDGAVQEGEEITLVAPPAYAVTSTTVMRGGLYGVIKAITEYPINLYEFDGTANLRMLAWYEPSEEVPIYRKLYLPGLSLAGDCCANSCGCGEVEEDDNETCTRTQIDTLVKLQHVPAIADNDPLVIGNAAALKLMAMAIQREEQERLQESAYFEGKAKAELDGEHAAYHGTGTVLAMQVQDRATFGVGGSDLSYGWGGGW